MTWQCVGESQESHPPTVGVAFHADMDQQCDDVCSTDCFVDGADRSGTASESCDPKTLSAHRWCFQCAPVERLRRSAALYQVCTRLLSVPEAHRPRKPETLTRWLRKCTVRTYAVRPLALARALDAPDAIQARLRAYQPPFPVEFVEDIEAAPLQELRKRWNGLKLAGWPGRVPACEVELWFVANANVRVSYDLDAVISVLCDLGLISSSGGSSFDYSGLTHDACKAALQAHPNSMLMPWQVARPGPTTLKLRYPLVTAGQFIGKAGVNIKAFHSRLEDKLGHHIQANATDEPDLAAVPAGHRLWINVRETHVTFTSRERICTKATADVVVVSLQEYLHKLRQASRRERSQLQQRWFQEGLQYHTALRTERQLRKNSRWDSLVRALAPKAPEMPGIRWRGGICARMSRWRRQVDMQHKRQCLMRACRNLRAAQRQYRGAAVAEAGHWGVVFTARDDPNDFGASLLNSSHLVHLCQEDRPQRRSSTHGPRACKDIRRMQRFLANAVDMCESVALPVVVPVWPQQQRAVRQARQRRCERKPKRRVLFDEE